MKLKVLTATNQISSKEKMHLVVGGVAQMVEQKSTTELWQRLKQQFDLRLQSACAGSIPVSSLIKAPTATKPLSTC